MHSPYTTNLVQIYGPERAAQVEPRLQACVARSRGRIPVPAESGWSERDALLIAYPDQLRAPGEAPLRTLAEFCRDRLTGLVSGIHLLPFFPWSSDDGFAVKDYRAVDPHLGSWAEVEALAGGFRLMVDGVVNHASTGGGWFQAFLRDEAPYRDYFLTVSGEADLSRVVRPRTSPLLTEFATAAGGRRVWTTFGPDQADLDYHNPDVLLDMLAILLSYAQHGAQFLRLDAIAYLWKEPGTTCLHLPQVHAFVRLLRAVLDEAAPHVRLVTETNVPHRENLAYFGNGRDEAQLVYNFALPPLVLHTFRTGDAAALSHWAAGLEPPSGQTTFLNFLASHDGIGLNPVRGILPEAEIAALVGQAQAHGGLVSYKGDAGGGQSPYELNVNYFDALSAPGADEPLAVQVGRFLAAQAILLALRGVPALYFHSLFGSRGWPEGVQRSGSKRAINRQKLERAGLEAELADPGSRRAQVFEGLRSLLEMRRSSSAFHPDGGQEVLEAGPGVFAVLRTSPDGAGRMLCLQNVTARPQAVRFANTVVPLAAYQTRWSPQ